MILGACKPLIVSVSSPKFLIVFGGKFTSRPKDIVFKQPQNGFPAYHCMFSGFLLDHVWICTKHIQEPI